MMLLLDDTSPNAIAVDTRLPESASKLASALVEEWPRLAGRIEISQRAMSEVELSAEDIVVSAHACGALTDEVIAKAMPLAPRWWSCRAATTRRRATAVASTVGSTPRSRSTSRGQRAFAPTATAYAHSASPKPSPPRIACSWRRCRLKTYNVEACRFGMRFRS